jgi:protoporphyrinogen oxidase
VYLFITINKPSVMKDQWIYFPNPEIPFARISEMKNFSKKMSPLDKTSLFIEFFCWEGDEVWNKSKEELFELTISHLEKLDFLKRDEVIDIYHIKQKNSYPVYDLTYKEHLEIVKNYLNSFVNLIYIGRPGRFRYTNQDHSLEMGILAARSVIEGKSYDIENIGKEKEYFEKGYITNK